MKRAFDGVTQRRRIAVLGAVVTVFGLLGFVVGLVVVRPAKEAPAILAAAISAAGAFTVAVVSRRAAAEAAAVAAHRAEVGPLYQDIIRRYFALMPRPWRGEVQEPRRTAEDPLTDREVEFADFIDEATQKLLIWGSPSVVEGWLAYRRALARHVPGVTTDPYVGLDAWEQLILVFRRDLGHDDRRLRKRDLLRMYLNDVDESEATEPESRPPRSS